MGILCIIPCGKKKVWDKFPNEGPTIAREAYIGIFHNLCEQYAMTFFDEWVILSAKHGLLLPDDIIDENYDVTFNMKSDEIISIEQLKKQVIDKNIPCKQVVVLTGKKYKPIIEACFNEAENIEFPLHGSKGIGHMQQCLKKAIDQNVAIHRM